MKNRLTIKQLRFTQEFLVDCNGTQAAIRAGYTKRSASVTASRMLTNAKVQTEIQKGIERAKKATDITTERVLKQAEYMSFADIRELFTEDGHLLSVKNLPEGIAAAVQSIEVVVRPTGYTDENGNREVEHVHKIRLVDKRASLEMLFKHLGMFNDQGPKKGSIHFSMNYGPPVGREIKQGL